MARGKKAQATTGKEGGELLDAVSTLEHLRKLVVWALKSGGVPILYGPPGVGKSAFVASLLAGSNWGRLETLIGSQCTPEDVNGFPVEGKPSKDAQGVERPQVVYAARDMFIRLNQEGGILFLDEFTCTPHSVQAPLLRGIHDRVFGDYALDQEKVGLILAANNAEQAVNGSDLPGPTANRLVHLNYPVGNAARLEWCREFPGYWNNPPKIKVFGDTLPESHFLRARAFVAGFVASRGMDVWLNVPDDPVLLAGPWPSSRSWTTAARAIARTTADGAKPFEALDLVAGSVGSGVAAEFLTYMRQNDLPDPEAILANPSGYKLTGRSDIDHASLSAVVAAVQGNFTPDRFAACVEVLCERAARQGKSLETAVGPFMTLNKHFTKKLGDLPPKVFQAYNIAADVFKPMSDMIKSAK